jgi:hypothetical protein
LLNPPTILEIPYLVNFFSATINIMAAKYNELREQLDNELKIRGIDLSNKPKP